jgi:hypothetical protein
MKAEIYDKLGKIANNQINQRTLLTRCLKKNLYSMLQGDTRTRIVVKRFVKLMS